LIATFTDIGIPPLKINLFFTILLWGLGFAFYILSQNWQIYNTFDEILSILEICRF